MVFIFWNRKDPLNLQAEVSRTPGMFLGKQQIEKGDSLLHFLLPYECLFLCLPHHTLEVCIMRTSTNTFVPHFIPPCSILFHRVPFINVSFRPPELTGQSRLKIPGNIYIYNFTNQIPTLNLFLEL